MVKKPIESIENLTLPEGGQPPEMPCGTGIKKEGMTAGVQGICGKILTAGAAMLTADVTAVVADLGPDLGPSGSDAAYLTSSGADVLCGCRLHFQWPPWDIAGHLPAPLGIGHHWTLLWYHHQMRNHLLIWRSRYHFYLCHFSYCLYLHPWDHPVVVSLVGYGHPRRRAAALRLRGGRLRAASCRRRLCGVGG